MPVRSIPFIADLHNFQGSEAGDSVDLLVEVPHGATDAEDFLELASQLVGPLPDDLIHFFYVNTDIGAPETALFLAKHLTDRDPSLHIEVVRCRIPRTFIDVNRKIDSTSQDYKEGGVTPGIPAWSQHPADLKLLKSRYFAYQDLVESSKARMTPDGLMILLHTFSPRSVGVEVTENIVADLHRAYQPEVFQGWRLRPELELISQDLNGTNFSPQALIDLLSLHTKAAGLDLRQNTTYPLHPSTTGYHHAVELEDRILCLELRRDLLTDPFRPFGKNEILPELVEKVASPILDALLQWRSP